MELRGIQRNFADMVGALDATDQPKLSPAKKMKTGNFPWTEIMNGKFAQAVLKRKTHLKTDMNQETKFNLVANDLVQILDVNGWGATSTNSGSAALAGTYANVVDDEIICRVCYCM
jgi:hypothetical protein